MKIALLEAARAAAIAAYERVAKLLKLPQPRRREPEPFAAVEDATPSADELLLPNAARAGKTRAGKGGAAKGGDEPAEQSFDLRAALSALAANKAAVGIAVAAAAFLVVLAVTAAITSAPAKPMPAAARPTREGIAVASRMVVPPESSLAPRMRMEREGRPSYSVAEAFELASGGQEVDAVELAARNDAFLEALYRTVR